MGTYINGVTLTLYNLCTTLDNNYLYEPLPWLNTTIASKLRWTQGQSGRSIQADVMQI